VAEVDQPPPPAPGWCVATLPRQHRSLRADAPPGWSARSPRPPSAWQHPPAELLRRYLSTSWTCPRSPRTTAATLRPSPDSLTSILSGRLPEPVPAASPSDCLPGTLTGGLSSGLSAAICSSLTALYSTGASHGTVMSESCTVVPPTPRFCGRRWRLRHPPSFPGGHHARFWRLQTLPFGGPSTGTRS
jgi:hypothetical protein